MARLRYPLALLGIFVIALFLRAYFPYHNVFNGEWVNYQETDCWYNMRVITSLAQHFPHMMGFDPYGFYPSGMPITNPPFFYYLFAFVAWVIGLGHPTQHTIELVGACLPALLGALVVIPVFFLGKELFNKTVGLLAAALIAILPGQFLWRGELGFPDYHSLEALLSATALLFFMMALQRVGKSQWLYSSLAGILLALYLLSWVGGGLFIFIIFVFILLQALISHVKSVPNTRLCTVGLTAFLVAVVLILLSGYRLWNLQLAPLLLSVFVFASLQGLSALMKRYRFPRLLYPIIVLLLVAAGLGMLSIIKPEWVSSILSQFGVFGQSGGMLTIAEVKGMTLKSSWQQFSICFYLFLAALAVVAYQALRGESVVKTLLLVWGVILLAATFGQNRFTYYLAIPVALLSAYALWQAARYVISVIPAGKTSRAEARRKLKKGKHKQKAKKQRLSPQVSGTIFMAIIIVLVAFLPNALLAVDRVQANTGMPSDWHNALVWLGNNTPEPLSHMSYYATDEYPEIQDYEQADYGVLSWWDYGYWITYISHRIPNANPSQLGAKEAGQFFTEGNETRANELLEAMGSRYIIIDSSMASGKFYAMAEWAGSSYSKYYEYYYTQTESGAFEPVLLYYPEYYMSMCSRLYNFNGEPVAPNNTTWAISWRVQDGHKIISDGKQFATYAEAEAFLRVNTTYHLVSNSPSSCPVPLEKLEAYKLVYNANSVKVFEYTKEVPPLLQ